MATLPLVAAVVATAADSPLTATAGNAPPETENIEPGPLYAQHCASCHGRDMRGASASALIKHRWQYGRDLFTVFQNIKWGIPDTDMPAWADILTDGEALALAHHIERMRETAPPSHESLPESIETTEYPLRLEVVGIDELKHPWAIEFISEDAALITEKGGRLRWLRNGVVDPKPVTGLPEIYTKMSTGGLMDLALDPEFNANGWIYLAYSYSDGAPDDANAPALTRIVRGRVTGYRWIDQETLFDAGESLRVVGGNRWGCRFEFDTEGRLLFTIGDMGRAEDSQDLTKATGKIFRIHRDGTIPRENPFVDTPGALPAIFSIGNRNTQGLARHPETGVIWSTDHGPRGGDELNVLEPGVNYGWPTITYGIDYSGKTVSEFTHRPGMRQPVVQWTPSKAVAPVVFSDSPLFPAWRYRLLVGSLGLEELWLYTLEDEQIVGEEMLFKGLGRVRDLKFAPSGALYVVMNNPDLLLRVTPVNDLTQND